MRSAAVYAAILLSFGLWYVMFVAQPLNFWLMMSLSTGLLSAISFACGSPLFSRDEFNWFNWVLGAASAATLYGVFWLGHQGLILVEGSLPQLLPDRAGSLRAIYANRGTLPPELVAALLFFPIGFGEELFWRGFVQRHFGRMWNRRTAFLVTTLLYTSVHLSTGNPVLILAALVCGVCWGALYWLTGNLLPVVVSHMLWDPFIFIIRPIM